jgi:hypothetical protein
MKEIGKWMSQASGTKARLGSESANARRLLGPLICCHFFSAYFFSNGWWALTSQTTSISANNVGFPVVTSIIIVWWISFVEADADEVSLPSTNLPNSLTVFTARMRWHVTWKVLLWHCNTKLPNQLGDFYISHSLEFAL